MPFKYIILKQNQAVPDIPEIESLEKPIADQGASEPEWQRIHQIADAQIDEFTNEYVETFQEAQEEVSIIEMRDGFIDNDLDKVDRAIDWQGISLSLGALTFILSSVLETAGQEMRRYLPPTMRGFAFSLDQIAEARDWISQRGTRLITQITDSTRIALRKAILRAQVEGLGANRAANHILGLIGLTDRQMRAVDNFRRNLMDQGLLNFDQIFNRTREYANRHLNYRAERIARTELMAAANEGHVQMYNTAAKEGFINANIAKKRWLVTPDDRLCPYCDAMDGTTVNLDQYFNTDNGLMNAPPLHPNCRCGIEILPEG